MSAIKDPQVHRAAKFALKHLVVPIITAISQTDLVAFKTVIGYKFQIVGVRSWNSAKAGAVAYKVKAGTRESVAAGVFTAATDVAATLSTTKANNRGSSTEALSVEYTSDGSGALTNGFVVITVRVWPLNGDLGPGA